jgi:hypothetical protein
MRRAKKAATVATATAGLGAQIAQQRDKLTETVGAIADKVDTQEIAGALKERASTGVDELRDTAQDTHGRKGLIIGSVAALIGLVLLRRLLS